MSVAHTWHVGDAVAFAERSAEPWAEVYLAIQVTLRDALTGLTAEQVVAELEDGMTLGIGGWGSRRKPMALVRAILALAGTLGIETVGEGIEKKQEDFAAEVAKTLSGA